MGPPFCATPLNLYSSDCFSRLSQVSALVAGIPQEDCGSCTEHQGCTWQPFSPWQGTYVTYSRHSTKVLSARALQSKCLFPWETRGLWGDALRLGKYSAPQQTFTQSWIEYFICGCKMKIFQLYPSFTFINWQFCIERNFPFPIYLFFSIGMDSCNLLSPSILQFTTVTHFDAQTLSVKLALVFLWHAPVWALPHFLAQDILGLSCAFPAPSPRSSWFLLVDNKVLKPRVGRS